MEDLVSSRDVRARSKRDPCIAFGERFSIGSIQPLFLAT